MSGSRRLSWHNALLVFLLLLTAACTHPPAARLDIDRSIVAQGQSSRVRYIILHYTVAPRDRALRLLSQGEVSSHYLITDDEPPRIHQLVDENRSAWHAGESHWQGRTWLNASSIGIEIVNRGYDKQDDGSLSWQPYNASQITALIALVTDIGRRHGIAPENVLGHSDIAPQRKQDPGPAFPWQQLAEAGWGRWYDARQTDVLEHYYSRHGIPDTAWFQRQLSRIGYDVPTHGVLDAATRNVLGAFQMHYRPARFDGEPDARTAALLDALP